jgi:hypothetical protein
METIGNFNTVENEAKKTYRIEHLPGLDVIENLDYPEKKDRDDILGLLRSNPLGKNLGFEGLSRKIQNLKQDGNRCFFVKTKGNPTIMVDYILNRNGRSLAGIEFAEHGDFRTKEAQFTRAGVLSEIIISPEVKNVVASNEVQELAKKHGFTGLKFAEPIFALTFKESAKKALIYKNIKRKVGSPGGDLKNLAEDLKKVFLQNSIHPHDFHAGQFMVIEQDGKPCVVLIDIESYTEVEKSDKV